LSIYLPLILYFIVFPLGLYFYFCRNSQVDVEAQEKKPAASASRRPAVTGQRITLASTVPVEAPEKRE
jgi:Na+/H+ antiporter NhaD/arsenite permease-like protein